MEAPTKAVIFKTVDKGQVEKTGDGFRNFVAKLGVSPRGGCEGDNPISAGFYEFNLVTRNRIQLEAAYRGSWIVGRVVNSIAEDMTRAGIDITTNDGAEELEKIEVAISRLQIWNSLRDTCAWGRLYGGAIGVLQIKGQKLSTPLDPDTVGEGQFLGLAVYDRWQLNPLLGEVITEGPDIGLPKYYEIVLGSLNNTVGIQPGVQETANPNNNVRVHHSRCIRMGGHKLPYFQAITEMMWEESVLERMWDRLIEFDTATASCGNLINRAQLRTVGIDGLREILAAGGPAQAALLEQFELMRQLQQNEGITMLDKEDTFASTAYSFAGLSDILIQFGEQVSGSAEIPLVRLFGQTPTGLNSNGDNDIRQYYDTINAKQEATLRNAWELLLKILWLSVLGKPRPDDLTFGFTPLWQMSATDKATVAKTNTDTILAAHESGVVSNGTALKELKQVSGQHGLFTNITDEEIKEAEEMEPPEPVAPVEGDTPELDDKADEAMKAKKTGDSAWKKIKAWLKS